MLGVELPTSNYPLNPRSYGFNIMVNAIGKNTRKSLVPFGCHTLTQRSPDPRPILINGGHFEPISQVIGREKTSQFILTTIYFSGLSLCYRKVAPCKYSMFCRG